MINKQNIYKFLGLLTAVLLMLFLYRYYIFMSNSYNGYDKYINQSLDIPKTLLFLNKPLNERGYYFKYKEIDQPDKYNLDKDGFILYSLTNRRADNYFQKVKIENVYHPLIIIDNGLRNYNEYLETGDLKYKKHFLKTNEWIINNLKTKEVGNIKIGYLTYNFDFTYVKAPWISAISQGLALSSLVYAYNLTNDNKYLESADLVKKFLFRSY